MIRGSLHPVVVAVVLIAVENFGILVGTPAGASPSTSGWLGTKVSFSSIEYSTPTGITELPVIVVRSSALSP